MKELVFPRLFVTSVERNADKVAVIGEYEGGYRATFAEHLDRVLRLKSALAGLGLTKDDRFAVLAGNSHRYLELWHAALFGAGIITPLNFRLAVPELEFILRDSGARVLFVDNAFASLVEPLRTAGFEKVVLLDEADIPHDHVFDDLIAQHEPGAADEPEEDDVAVLMYTGGTTGNPKGVLLQQKAIVLTVYHMDFMWRLFTNDDVCLLNAAMFHVAGAQGLMGTPAAGGTVVIQKSFDAAESIRAVDEYGVTLLGMVPTMVGMMLNHPDYEQQKLRTVRLVAYGGSPMPEALMNQILAAFPTADINQCYGMTESAAILSYLSTADHRGGGIRTRSAGRAIRGIRVEVRDPDTREPLPVGQDGEIVARTGTTMLGYWNRPEETAKALDGDWYYTGDMGHLDEDGYLFITDRVKDMIISGGENVYSAEVESALSTHPAVLQVAVIGVPSVDWGESVHAIIVLREGTTATDDEIRGYARERLANYKVPKTVEFRTEPLPLSGAMKVLKRQLREEHAARQSG